MLYDMNIILLCRANDASAHVVVSIFGPFRYLIQRCFDIVLWSLETMRLADKIRYHKISNIRRTKLQNLNDRLVLHLPFANPLKPGVKLNMKM